MMKITITPTNNGIIIEHKAQMEKLHHIQRLNPVAKIHVQSLDHAARLVHGLDHQPDRVPFHPN